MFDPAGQDDPIHLRAHDKEHERLGLGPVRGGDPRRIPLLREEIRQ